MSIESRQSLGTIIKEDPQEINWRKKVKEWAHDEISYGELVSHYPSYLLSVPERIVRFVQKKASQIARKAESVK